MYSKSGILFIIFIFIHLDVGIFFSFGRIWRSRHLIPLSVTREHFSVLSNETGLRIDQFISSRKPCLSRNLLTSLYSEGHVLCNQKTILKKNKKVQFKDEIIVDFSTVANQNTIIVPQNIPLDILFENDNVIFVNKSVGMIVHPGAGVDNGTLVNALAHHLRDQSISERCVDTNGRPGIVHRLDKGTSGVMVIAKTEASYLKLHTHFKERQVIKTYLAITVGAPGSIGSKITVREPIARDKQHRKQMCVNEEGRMAVSHIYPLATDGKLCLSRVMTETGRTHQIRVHLNHLKTPILGDGTYGWLDWNQRFSKQGVTRPLLHALSLKLPDCDLTSVPSVTCFPPLDFGNICHHIIGKSPSMDFLTSDLQLETTIDAVSMPTDWYK